MVKRISREELVIENLKLSKALKLYGHHLFKCDKINPMMSRCRGKEILRAKCTCGFDKIGEVVIR